MRLLVTRAAEDGKATAADLAARGHQAYCIPLTAINFEQNVDLELGGVQALLITSANALRAFAALSSNRELRVLAVGAATAKTARTLGFHDVAFADGNASALGSLAARSCQTDRGPLIHLAGEHSANDLVEYLQEQGFDASRRVLYTAVAVAKIPDELKALLNRRQTLDGVLLHSKRSAEILQTLLRNENLTDACRTLAAYCLSPAIANTVKSLPYKNILVAAQPNQHALLDLLDRG